MAINFDFPRVKFGDDRRGLGMQKKNNPANKNFGIEVIESLKSNRSFTYRLVALLDSRGSGA